MGAGIVDGVQVVLVAAPRLLGDLIGSALLHEFGSEVTVIRAAGPRLALAMRRHEPALVVIVEGSGAVPALVRRSDQPSRIVIVSPDARTMNGPAPEGVRPFTAAALARLLRG